MEFQNTKAELQATQTELQSTKAELQATNERLESLVTETNKKSDFTISEAQAAQNTALKALSETKAIKAGIENGSIVAHKALMLRGKDDNHWMKFCTVDAVNHHWFQIW